MSRWMGLCLVFLTLPGLRASAQQVTPPARETVIGIDDAAFDEKAGRFSAAGKTSLPDGTTLCAKVVFAGNDGQFVRTKVAKGAFQVQFDEVGKKWVLCGSYRIQVEARPEDQGPNAQVPPNNSVSKEVVVGTPQKQAEEVATMKKQLLDFTENCHRLFLDCVGKADYILMGIERKKKAGLTAQDKAKYLQAWNDFAAPGKYWLGTYDRVRMGYDDYAASIYLSYYPQVEQDLRAVLETLEKWFYSYWHDICAALDQEIPQEIQERGQFFDRGSVESELEGRKNQIYAGLQVTPLRWHAVSLWDSEEGQIVKNTYTSKHTLFEVSRPDDQWDFEPLTADPVLRLRIKPHDAMKAAKGSASIEVKDFPDSTGPQDLRDLVEMTAHDRYPSYKKIAGKSISVPDVNFPGGNRPGFDLLFLFQTNSVNQKARSYELFCGTFKRTYAVVCIAYAEEWGSFEKDFETICKSFKVLPQPIPEGDQHK